jgi:RecA-family ATPase
VSDVDAFSNHASASTDSEAAAGERHPNFDPTGLPSVTLHRLPLDWHYREPAPRRWIVEAYLPAETSTLLISLGGLGKSYLILYLSLCVALGIDFCGQPCEQGRVVIVSGEDDFNEVWRRLLKLVRHLGPLLPSRALETLRETIEVVDVKQWRRARGASPVLTKSDRGSAILTPLVGHIARAIGNANLVVFDTVSRFNGAEENSNDAMARLVDAFEIISEETHSAVLSLAHTGIKGKGGAVDQYSSRGASALSDNSRSVTVLAPLDGGLIEQLSDIQQREKASRNDLLRLCHVKANYAHKVEDVYFERHAHGVLVPTQPTFQSAMTEAVLVDRLLARVGNGAVTRNQMRELAPELPATRDAAFTAFDTAVLTGRLVHSGTYRGSTRYRVKPVEATRTLLAANSDLIADAPATDQGV